MKLFVLLTLMTANMFAQNVNHQCSIELTTKGFQKKNVLARQKLFDILDDEKLEAKSINFKYKGKNYQLDLDFEFEDPNYIYVKNIKSSYLRKIDEGSYLIKEIKNLQFHREMLVSSMLNQTYGTKTFSAYNYNIAQSLQSEGTAKTPAAAVFTNVTVKKLFPFAKKFDLTIDCSSSY
ncbi:hypothetical protein N9N67_08680 [Bacteriovoracaceae bacterium]|nr:hypothetical protein [Bacteriovoracaceae bacterium]